MMKWRMWAFYAITICLAVFFVGGIWKSICLYQKYPNPPIRTYSCGDPVQIGSYEIVLGDWKWDDGTEVKTRFPEYVFPQREIDGKLEDMRVGLITFYVTKNTEGDDKFAFPDVGFSSGAWDNQYDMELYYLLNSHLRTMTLDLAVGETQYVILPLVILEGHLPEAQWQMIDSREFYINLRFYPEHIRVLCGGV